MAWPKALSDADYKRQWLARVFANVVKDANGCWLWQGFKTVNGYGSTSYRNKSGRVHRYVYVALNGPISSTLDVCHTCDVRLCINPDHLWAGTRKQNVEDMIRKRRHYNSVKTICIRGHALTPDNVYQWHDGVRRCRECSRMRFRKGWKAVRRKGRKRDEPGWTYSAGSGGN
jgi:hypothetical protein